MIELDKIYNEDCLVGMSRIPDNSVDAIICDLPYGTTDCQWDSIIPLAPLWEHYKRILKHQGSVLLFGSEPFSTMLRTSNLDWFKYDWIWIKNHATGFQHAKNMPMKDYEIISVFSGASMGHANLLAENRMTYNPQGVKRCHVEYHTAKRKFVGTIGTRPSQKDHIITDSCNYPKTSLYFSKESNAFHPTQKPVSLLQYLVLTYTNENDIVLDNCMGSGTTAVACIREHRHFIGFELDEKYFKKSCERIESEKRQIRIF